MNDSQLKISVVLATFNEEKNLPRCLTAVKDFASEIIVVDGQSTDKTVALAKSFGAQVFVTTNKPIFHINKQMAIDKATGDWILQLDADEIVTPALAQELQAVVTKEVVAYYLSRKNYFLGRWLRKGGQYPDYVIRFFKKGKAYLPCHSVHEQMVVDGHVGYSKNDLLHYPFPDFSQYLVKLNRYTLLQAKEHRRSRLPLNLLTIIQYLIIGPIKKFLTLYVLYKGFLDGVPGFIYAFFSSLQEAISFLKYWELIRDQRI